MTILEAQSHSYDMQPNRPELIETGRGIGTVEAFYGNTDRALLSELLPIRKRFVVDIMKWQNEDHEEGDRYDEHPDTLHLALRTQSHEEGKIISSLRLTSTHSLEESLSVEMLNTYSTLYDHVQQTMPDAVNELNSAGARGNLYDLTRLVSNIKKGDNIDEVLQSFMELFGVAAGVTRNKSMDVKAHEDIKWMFVLTEGMRGVLLHQGVELVDLANGYLSEDDVVNQRRSYFSFVRQESAIRSVFEHEELLPHAAPHLRAGLAKAGWTT